MTLPLLALQVLYAPVAWAMVLGACGVGLLSRIRPFPETLATSWLVVAFIACVLPGQASAAYWLGLAWQMPSGYLMCLCVLAVWNRGQDAPEHRVLPTGLALGLVLTGAVLYADAWGWLPLGLYMHGFGPEAVRVGLLVGLVAVVAVLTGLPHRPALAAVAALALFALWRLPTGNVWDAFLDPLLWLWALCSLIARLVARWRARRAAVID